MRIVTLIAFALVVARPIYVRADDKPDAEGFYSLFDGKTLDGWKASENKDAWAVEDGTIAAKSGRSHLFYDGPVNDHDFTNFELKADVMTKPGREFRHLFSYRVPGKGLAVSRLRGADQQFAH